MNRVWRNVLVVAMFAAAAPAFGETYSDTVGDLHDGTGGGANFSGFTHLDIASVEVTDDGTDITFSITLNGNIASTDWGKYMIGIDSSSSDPGDSGGSGGNPWGPRPIIMTSGMDYWIGSWADGGGGHQVWNYNDTNPGNWSNPAGNEPADLSAAASGVISLTASLSELGLGVGDTIYFDVFSSGGGGGDGAVDALSSSTPSITDWGNPYDSPGNSGLREYTIVPEPVTLGLLGLGSLAIGMGCWRRRR